MEHQGGHLGDCFTSFTKRDIRLQHIARLFETRLYPSGTIRSARLASSLSSFHAFFGPMMHVWLVFWGLGEHEKVPTHPLVVNVGMRIRNGCIKTGANGNVLDK